MLFKKEKIQAEIDLKFFAKILTIIIFWETIIMIVIDYVLQLSQLQAIAFDAFALAVLSSFSIWYLVFLPEKKQSAHDLSNSLNLIEQKLKAINEIAIISSTDLNGKIIYANENFCRITGYSLDEILNQDHRILNSGHHPKEFFREMWKTLHAGKSWRGKIKNKSKDGNYYWVDSYNVPISDMDGNICNYFSFRFDITAEKLNEEALELEKNKSIHLGRLSAIGEMASGVAHEINNPLFIVAGQLSIIERRLNSKNPLAEIPTLLNSIGKAKKQVTRITKIIKGLKEFSRSDNDAQITKISVKVIIDSIIDMCGEMLKKNEIEFKYKYEDIEIECNHLQIEQVLLNLINNSVDAIQSLDHKWISIDIHTNHKNEFVTISIADSGEGINSELAEKIMQPFFTTKEIGKGTGLGLSISKGIIEKHGGMLYIDKNSINTRFVIEIPKHESALIQLLDIDEAISSHLAWREKLVQHLIIPDPSFNYQVISADNCCAVGKWIDKIEPRFSQYQEFRNLKNVHSEFHRCAGEIAQVAITKSVYQNIDLDMDTLN